MLFCVASVGSSVVYLRHQITNTAKHVKQIESKIVVEERRYSRLGAELSQAMATNKLVLKNENLGLGLAIPRDDQIVRVAIDADQRLLNKASKGLLSSNNF